MQSANTVGGMRTAAGRRTAQRRSGPASGEGAAQPAQKGNSIMSFYSGDDGAGLKVGPVTVLVMSLSFMAVVVMLHILQKFRMAIGA